MAAVPDFELPSTGHGWAPASTPDKYKDLPFAQFARSDKLGRVADFGGFAKQGVWGHYSREQNVDLAYRHDRREEATFQLIDSTKARPAGGGMKRRRNPRQAAQDALFEDARLPQSRKELKLLAQAMNGKKGSRGMRKAVGAKRIIGRRFTRHNGRYRNASVEVGADWTLLQQFELHKFEALHTSEPTVTDLHWAGSLKSYNSTLDSVDVKSAAPVRVNPKTDFFMVRPAEDPVLEELAEADLGNVFATEAVLAALMAAPRSAAPWDVVVTYLPGGMIFLDVRDAAEFESVSVHETARRAPHEKEEYDGDINTAGALSEEATRVNRALTQSVLKRQAAAAGKPAAETLGIDLKPHPFFDEEEAEEGHTPAHMAYRYRRFDMGDNIHIIARTAVHAAEQRYGQVKLTNVHALLEVDPRNTRAAPWRVQAATKRGSLLVEELGNNGYQAAKWVAGSFLSGVDQIRLGFVSRTNQDSNDSHKLLGMQSFEPAVLAHQMSLSSSNMWGVLKWAIMLVRKNAELLRGDEDEDSFAAKFVLLKDPNQPMVALYTVPLDEFDEEESEDEDSDEEDNEEEL